MRARAALLLVLAASGCGSPAPVRAFGTIPATSPTARIDAPSCEDEMVSHMIADHVGVHPSDIPPLGSEEEESRAARDAMAEHVRREVSELPGYEHLTPDDFVMTVIDLSQPEDVRAQFVHFEDEDPVFLIGVVRLDRWVVGSHTACAAGSAGPSEGPGENRWRQPA